MYGEKKTCKCIPVCQIKDMTVFFAVFFFFFFSFIRQIGPCVCFYMYLSNTQVLSQCKTQKKRVLPHNLMSAFFVRDGKSHFFLKKFVIDFVKKQRVLKKSHVALNVKLHQFFNVCAFNCCFYLWHLKSPSHLTNVQNIHCRQVLST